MKNLTAVAFLSFVLTVLVIPQASDSTLRGVTSKDKSNRTSNGKLDTLSAAEHLSRGQTYFDNRQFPQAREHFQKIFDNYPIDPAMSTALFLTGRSYYWEREYARAIPYLDRVAREYPDTKDGREGLNFKGACNVRLSNNDEAARVYEQYTVMYPTGERFESAHLNIIDALREAGRYDDADAWIEKARTRFAGKATETNALQGRLRMQIFRGLWPAAVATADSMLSTARFGGSMTSTDEVKFLKALAYERSGSKQRAMDTFGSIPNNFSSYYGGLASEKLARNGAKFHVPPPLTAKQIADSPAPYRSDILFYTKKHKIDPRFVLAIMKQESTFRPDAKSPSAARGLLQLVYDTALKYKDQADFPVLQPDELYVPRTNIAIGCEYIAALKKEFGGLDEAVAASYNGGEDNAARWLNRSNPKEPGVFAAEVGFAETKNYVFKIMTNYRIYRELYDENLNRK
ncbi:MAG: transglycosylase SLT domain-containing protein [Pyrinomonadaceae bacterium]